MLASVKFKIPHQYLEHLVSIAKAKAFLKLKNSSEVINDLVDLMPLTLAKVQVNTIY